MWRTISIDIGKNNIRLIAGDTERSFVLWRKLSPARVVARLAKRWPQNSVS
jgi:hypothetical protein